MNLSDLTNYVCAKSQLVETNDQTAAQLFLSKRYELIYNSYLWKDSLAMVNVPFDPVNNADNAAGIVLLPQQIDRLVAIRTLNNSVRINGLEHYYRIDWDKFGQQEGTLFAPSEMSLLNPIWISIRNTFIAPNLSNLVPTNSQYDVSSVFTLTGLTPGLTYKYTSGSNEAIAYNGGSGPHISSGYFVSLDGTLVLTGTNQLIPVTASVVVANPDKAVSILASNMAATPTGDAAAQVKIVWRDSVESYVTTSTLPVTLTPASGATFIEIEAIYKPLTIGSVQVLYGATVLGTLQPTDLRSPSFQRVRVFPIPNQAINLNVLGKKPFVPLTHPQESPGLRNLDNCLIAFAVGDMFTRARFPAEEAAPHYQEGAVLLQELAKLETIQAANNTRFVPDSGYGDAYFNAANSSGGWIWDY